MDHTIVIEKISPNKLTADISKNGPNSDAEKCDISPEYLEKSSSSTTIIDDQKSNCDKIKSMENREEDNGKSDSGNEKSNKTSEGSAVQNKAAGFAFTIDFNEGKMIDKRKLKEMTERFQNRQLHQQEKRRHHRGVSLSKLEDCRKSSISLNNTGCTQTTVDDSSVSSTVIMKPPFKQRNTVLKIDVAKSDPKVALRISRPTATNKSKQESMKRHSWSPRSSLNSEKPDLQILNHQNSNEQAIKYFQPKSATLQRTLDVQNKIYKGSKTKPTIPTVDRVVTTPLEYVKSSDDEASVGDVSQATYTLDGDNYTEEEKERMSIDKFNRSDFNLSIESLSSKELIERNSSSKNPHHGARNSGSLKQSQPLATQKSAKFYLDKIKTHVKSIGDRTFQNSNEKYLPVKSMNSQFVYTSNSSGIETDHGTFTR